MRPWLGRDAALPGVRLLARALGARDIVLAVGTLTAADDTLPRWLTGALAADATDLAVTVAGRDHLPRGGRELVMAIAATAVALGAVAIVTAPEPKGPLSPGPS